MGGEEFGFDAYARPRINPQSAFSMGMTRPYPLLLKPILLPKVWGGRRLERFGKRLPAGQNVGESWELADLGSTSASGAGGGAARSEILNGPLQGQTIDHALLLWGADLLGRAQPTSLGGFPLLVKFLDARENLSVQVHPTAAYAAAHPGAHLKTECWYVLEAEPGAVIYKGIQPGVDRRRFERAVRESARQAEVVAGWKGTDSMPEMGDEVVRYLAAVPAVPGECHTLPSGTCHALGAGVLVAEVQTPSDTTFRIYDWGRIGRELHIDQAMQCIDFGPPPGATSPPAPSGGRLASTEFFAIEEVRLEPGQDVVLGDACRAVMLLRGEGALAGGGSTEPMRLGQTALLPAAVKAVFTVSQPMSLLVTTLATGSP